MRCTYRTPYAQVHISYSLADICWCGSTASNWAQYIQGLTNNINGTLVIFFASKALKFLEIRDNIICRMRVSGLRFVFEPLQTFSGCGRMKMSSVIIIHIHATQLSQNDTFHSIGRGQGWDAERVNTMALLSATVSLSGWCICAQRDVCGAYIVRKQRSHILHK